MDLSQPVSLKGSTYFPYESVETGMIIMTDIKRNINRATFFQLDETTLQFSPVKDEKILFDLFVRTNYKTEFNPMLFDDTWIYPSNYSYKDRPILEDKIVEIFRYDNGIKYNDTICFKKQNFQEESFLRTIISDTKSKKGVLLASTRIDQNLANLYFIEINAKNQTLETREQTILFEGLGFDYESIKLINTYDSEGVVDGKYHVTLFFNIDNDKKLGVSTIYFDFEKETFQIRSEVLIDHEKPLPKDFNEVYVERQSIIDELTYIIQIPESNDLYTLSLNSEESNTEIFRNAVENLSNVFKEKDQFIFIYDGLCKIDSFDQKKVTTNPDSHDYDIVVYSNQKSYLFRQSVARKSELNKSLIKNEVYAVEQQKISNGITFYYYFEGDWNDGISDYKMYEINLILTH
jgi:hypothetical protein